MNKMKMLNNIKTAYLEGENIIKYLKKIENRKQNSIEDILISYDFQAGTYIENFKKDSSFQEKYSYYISKVIRNLGEYNSILEVGVGEATTLGPLISSLQNPHSRNYGFDISWSRIKYGKKFLKELNIDNVELFTGDLFDAPLKDNSIDIVYTSHSIEPNGGKEKEALMELYRITSKYLILLEPSYEFASEEAKRRMDEHGYVTNLLSTSKELGYEVIEHRLFDLSINPLNPTGLIIIKKGLESTTESPLCCPITKTSISKIKGSYFSEQSLIAYPVIDDIPCLLPENGIVATKFI